ncbi:MAG TPA: permease-like cell division protein FtsX, partial [Patescibacteria group bacterium]
MSEATRRVVRFGVQNYWRNGWLSLAATLMMAMTLFIVSVFALQAYVIKITTKSIQDKLDMSIYVSDTPSEDAVAKLVSDLKATSEVKEVIYLDKSKVMSEWQKLQVDQSIKDQVNNDNNPLPRTI